MIEYIKRGFAIFRLDESEIKNAAKDPNSTSYVFLIVMLVGAAQAIGSLKLSPSMLAFYISSAFIGAILGTMVLHFLAWLFGGKATFLEFFRPIGMSYVVMWITIIPVIGPAISGVIGIWYVAVNLAVIRIVHRLSLGKAALVILIPVLIALAIAILMILGYWKFVTTYLGSLYLE
ncbi:MAG: YIP1 family protein [Candidatus Woesearchaeota archaeon]|nr:YIP1 family protein [Candidatus Woesearchaeota archaeon]